MSLRSLLFASGLAVLASAAFSTGVAAEDTVRVEGAYARSASINAKTGAIFMVLVNPTSEDDRLTGVRSDSAARVELHTHEEGGDGVMRMVHLEDGMVVPAGGRHVLERGGDHVMLMGLTVGLAQGDTVPVTLVFERAGEITLEVPVDLTR